MDSYEVMHTYSNLDFTGYTYFQVCVNDGDTLTYKGNSITPSGGPVVLNISVSNANDVVGTTSTVVFLGKKRPELTKTLNSDGTWSIKG
jgi:hypothetical protein